MSDRRFVSSNSGIGKGFDVRDVHSYHVAWFVRDEAIPDVTVRIGEDKLLSIESGRAPDAIELGNVSLVSGLVNAHTHLEFSEMYQPIPIGGRFTDWIRAVVEYRRNNTGSVSEAIRSGLRESLESGTTLLADIATSGWSWQDYSASILETSVFQEVLGLSPERVVQQKEIARNHFRKKELSLDLSEDTCTNPENTQRPFWSPVEHPNHFRSGIGISPHAPYSTHLELVRDAVDLARQSNFPLAMHLAETRTELEFLAERTGEFREMLNEFGLWQEDPSRFGRRPMEYLEILSEAPHSLIIHGNYLSEDELEFMATKPQMTLVYCPRTHAAFGHSEHPWRRAKQLGVRVAIGTDSRASNPDLSIFAELKFLARNAREVSHVDLLQLGSLEARRALGVERSDEANFTLIRLEDSGRQDPQKNLFSAANRVCGTMVNGRWSWHEASQ